LVYVHVPQRSRVSAFYSCFFLSNLFTPSPPTPPFPFLMHCRLPLQLLRSLLVVLTLASAAGPCPSAPGSSPAVLAAAPLACCRFRRHRVVLSSHETEQNRIESNRIKLIGPTKSFSCTPCTSISSIQRRHPIHSTHRPTNSIRDMSAASPGRYRCSFITRVYPPGRALHCIERIGWGRGGGGGGCECLKHGFERAQIHSRPKGNTRRSPLHTRPAIFSLLPSLPPSLPYYDPLHVTHAQVTRPQDVEELLQVLPRAHHHGRLPPRVEGALLFFFFGMPMVG
jgi:hypothetical protein